MGAGKEELMVGAVLVHVMEVATMNSHEIGQLQVSDSCWRALYLGQHSICSLSERLGDRVPTG
jgi:hypothetical protein